MSALLPIAAAGGLLFTLAGFGIVALVPAEWRPHLIPAVPVVGAMALVVALHATTFVVGVDIGLFIALAALAVAVALRSRRNRWWRGLDLRWFAAAVVAGAIPFLVVIGPARAAGATLVLPPPNGDAYAYVTVNDWLLSHPYTSKPADDSAIAWNYVRVHQDQGLRVGEDLDQAAVAAVMHRDPIEIWNTLTALWLLFLPGAGIALFSMLGLPRVAGLAGGLVASVASVVDFQTIEQNSPSLLGIAVAPVTLGLACCAVEAATSRAAGVAAPPWWLTAGAVGAMVGTYTEYLPVIAPGVVAYVLWRRRDSIVPAVLTLLRLLALSAVLVPLAWYNAVRSLRITTAISDTVPGYSPYYDTSTGVTLARLLGATGQLDSTSVRLGELLAVCVAGLLAAVLFLGRDPARRLLVTLSASVIVVAVYLTRPHPFSYGQRRAIEIGAPIVVFAATAGAVAIVDRVRAVRPGREAAGVALAAAGAFALAFTAINVRTVRATNDIDVAHAHVDPSFAQVAAWVQSVGGPGGRDAMVIDYDYFDQLWLMYALRDEPAVDYPFVRVDYTHVSSAFAGDDGKARRYAIVGPDVLVDGDPSATVQVAGRFRLMDLSRGKVVLTYGVQGFQPNYRSGFDVHQWYTTDIAPDILFVVHSADVVSATITTRCYTEIPCNVTVGAAPPLPTGGDATVALPPQATIEQVKVTTDPSNLIAEIVSVHRG